ncbi:hypothetical protein DFH09DRAFT_272238 [Mycena vulgaris]|nr:hypothetical protein DFH09DRAFT_272238 [Mycena vulgaris]
MPSVVLSSTPRALATSLALPSARVSDASSCCTYDRCLPHAAASRRLNANASTSARVSGNALPSGRAASTASEITPMVQSWATATLGQSTGIAGYTSAPPINYPKAVHHGPAQPWAKVTATITHGPSTWTTVYTSYVGTPYSMYAPSPVKHVIKIGADGLNFTTPKITSSIGDIRILPYRHAFKLLLKPWKPLALTPTMPAVVSYQRPKCGNGGRSSARESDVQGQRSLRSGGGDT